MQPVENLLNSKLGYCTAWRWMEQNSKTVEVECALTMNIEGMMAGRCQGQHSHTCSLALRFPLCAKSSFSAESARHVSKGRLL